MKGLLPVLLLAVALTAFALWHARTRETDGRKTDARPVLSGNEAQTTDVPENEDGGTEAARQPVSDEDVVLDEDVLEEILLYASRAIRDYGFNEIDRTKQPLVGRCKAGLCVTFPRIAAPTRPAGRRLRGSGLSPECPYPNGQTGMSYLGLWAVWRLVASCR